jgi:hypothetical protein
MSATDQKHEDIVLAMKIASGKIGLDGPQKRLLVLDTLIAAGLIRDEDREAAGATIDALVWAAKHRSDVAHFAKRTKLCCLGYKRQ